MYSLAALYAHKAGLFCLILITRNTQTQGINTEHFMTGPSVLVPMCCKSSWELDLGNEKKHSEMTLHKPLQSQTTVVLLIVVWQGHGWICHRETSLCEGCRIDDWWVQYLIHCMNQLVSSNLSVFRHTKQSGVPQLTEQMFAVTTSCYWCVWRLKLISKLTRKSSFSYFAPWALLSAPRLCRYNSE